MPVFGEAQDQNLYLGRLYRQTPHGSLYEKGGATTYTKRNLIRTFGGPLSSAASWGRWRDQFRQPARGEPDTSRFLQYQDMRRPKASLTPAGALVRAGVFLRLLTIKKDDVVLVQGQAATGIGIDETDVPVIVYSGSETITVEKDDAVVT